MLNRIAMALTIGSFTARSVRIYDSPSHRYSIDLQRLYTLMKSNLLLSTVLKLKCNRELLAGSSNQQYMTRCIVHNESNPSMSISDSMGVYHCFSCGASGNLFTLIRTVCKVSSPDDVIRSIDILAEVDDEVKSCLVRNNLSSLSSIVDHHQKGCSSQSNPSGLYSQLNTNSNAVSSIQSIILLLEGRNRSLGNATDVQSRVRVPSSTGDRSSYQPVEKAKNSTNGQLKDSRNVKLVVTEDINAIRSHRQRMVVALKYVYHV